jgi:VWFA-related protein
MTPPFRFRVLASAAVLAFLTAGLLVRAQSQSDQNLVRVDVYPTTSGVPVTDLRATDFEVLEDDVAQKIESFEHVTIGSPPAPGGRSRIYVVFLDTYFTDVRSSSEGRTSLAAFLDRLVGPNDLVGIMTPDMAAADVTLVHRTGPAEDMLSKYWFWGRDLEAIDPVEEQYLECYPRTDVDPESGRETASGMGQEMVQRRREKRVIDALADLANHLRTVGDARKAVIAVTDGWVLFQPNLPMTERTGIRQSRFDPRRGGRRDEGPTPSDGGPSTQRCDQDRISLSLVDDRAKVESLVDAANRNNVSFYPITTGGLHALDPNAGSHPSDTSARPGVAADPKRAESLHSLATNTDGVSITGTADVDPALHRIVDDLSSYYLLGYHSTNPTPDGKFRKIEVRVTRPGLDVRTRRGYRVPKPQELVEPAATSSTTRAAPKTPLERALAELKADRPDVPLRIGAAYAPLGSADSTSGRVHVWAMAEIDQGIARHGQWIGGGTVELSVTARDGETLARKSVAFPGGERSATIDLGEVAAADGEAVVHASAHPAGGGHQSYAEALQLPSLTWPGRPLVYRRGPATAMKYVPTANPDFERTERIRVDLPLAAEPAAPVAELLDRGGKPMSIPASITTRTDGNVTWVTAEVALAPLAEGTYLVRIKPDKTHPEASVVSAFRIVP